MRELARYRSMSLALPSYGHGRLSTRHAHDRSLGYSAIISMVSVVEDFAVNAVRVRLEDLVSDGTNLMESARAELLRAVEKSWPDRTKMMRQWFRPSIATSTVLPEVLAFVEARNAMAHGLGRLTRRQLAGDAGKSVRTQLATVGITDPGGFLLVDERAVERCARSAKKLIIEWDHIARRGQLEHAS